MTSAATAAIGLILALLGPLAIALFGERDGRRSAMLRAGLRAQAAMVVLVAAVIAIALRSQHLPPAAIGLVVPTWYLAVAVLIGGTAEELLYRGYAIACLRDLTGSTVLASILPVVLFGIAHLPLWGLGPSTSTVVSSAIFTAFYLWSGDLAANIIAHVATDFIGIVLPRSRVARRRDAPPAPR